MEISDGSFASENQNSTEVIPQAQEYPLVNGGQNDRRIHININKAPIVIGCNRKYQVATTSKKPMNEFNVEDLCLELTKKCVSWRRLGTMCDFSYACLDRLYGDCDNDDAIMIHKILVRWILCRDKEATYFALKKILEELGQDASIVFESWMSRNLALT